jgi:hypothetical protein
MKKLSPKQPAEPAKTTGKTSANILLADVKLKLEKNICRFASQLFLDGCGDMSTFDDGSADLHEGKDYEPFTILVSCKCSDDDYTETIPKRIDVARIIFMMDDTFCVTDEHSDDWYIDEISIEEMARISDTLEMTCRSRGIKNGKDETVSIRCE